MRGIAELRLRYLFTRRNPIRMAEAAGGYLIIPTVPGKSPVADRIPFFFRGVG